MIEQQDWGEVRQAVAQFGDRCRAILRVFGMPAKLVSPRTLVVMSMPDSTPAERLHARRWAKAIRRSQRNQRARQRQR